MNNRPRRASAPAAKSLLDVPAFVRASLDCVQTNIFIADPRFNIIYANDRALQTLRGMTDVQRIFNVDVDRIVGGSIHRFHKDPRDVERILRDPAALPHAAEFSFGSVTLQTRINAVLGPGRDLLGYIVNWEDVTGKLEAERQSREAGERERRQAEDLRAKVECILEVVNDAGRGDLT
ncbi:MAG: PAS domain-containing protein, partial [Gemmataceae bacterium]